MNHFSAALLLSLAIFTSRGQAADDCCLCNDCDMMMKPKGQVYDLDHDAMIGCSEFAELIFAHVDGSHDICHGIQETFQSSCCMNNDLQDAAVDSDHRSLLTDKEATIPFSRRELWGSWTAYNSFGNTQSFGSSQSFFSLPPPPPPARSWGYSRPSPSPPVQTTFSAPRNNNGNALGCTVPSYNSARTVQVSTPSASGFGSVTSINCGAASRSGIQGVTSQMYNVALKCVRCNCCGQCSGIAANVCVGNNQPRQSAGTVGTWSARSGWRHLMESLGLDE